MPELTLSLLDTAGIQPYIFNSNRLPEIIGASQRVEEATKTWVYETLEKLWPGGHNIANRVTGELDRTRHIEREDDGLQAELIYAGGGNTALLFRTPAHALQFTGVITRRILRDAPGITQVVAHVQIAWESEALAHKVNDTIENKLAERKRHRPLSVPLLGLGVTAFCESTGLVASEVNDIEDLKVVFTRPEKLRVMSLEIASKLRARKVSRNRLKRIFHNQLEDYWEFPGDFDELGREHGEESYIAVVHADGNGMGELVQEIATKFKGASAGGSYAAPNRAYIEAMREFSDSTERASIAALQHIVSTLTRRPDAATHDLLPFRPLIFGGDDVTFVCNGRLGIPLAALFLEEFGKQTVTVAGEARAVYACAGISIVKTHYPFSRAVHLSEALTKSAKDYVKYEIGQPKTSALDWHFATSGLSGELATIRKREYTTQAGELLLRPVRLHPGPTDGDGRAWFERVESLIKIFNEHKDWSGKRNKLKALREALRAGPLAVKDFIATYGLDPLPNIVPATLYYQTEGWLSKRAGYFDALELMDHYEELPEPAGVQPTDDARGVR